MRPPRAIGTVNVSCANEVQGSQTGSQCRHTSGHIRQPRAIVSAASWPIRRRPAPRSDAADAPEKRKVSDPRSWSIVWPRRAAGAVSCPLLAVTPVVVLEHPQARLSPSRGGESRACGAALTHADPPVLGAVLGLAALPPVAQTALEGARCPGIMRGGGCGCQART